MIRLNMIATFIRRGYVPNAWEVVSGALPTWLGYNQYLKDDALPWRGYLFSSLILIAILVVLTLRRITKRNQMVSEALATGYFYSLWRPIAANIKHNGGRLGTSGLIVKKIRIYVPRNKNNLKALHRDFIARRTNGEYTQVNVVVHDRNKDVDIAVDNGQLVIHDFPNTLNSLHAYMGFESDNSYSNEKSVRYHNWFRDRLTRLLDMEDGSQVHTEIVEG
ncbi:MAG: hypothetical protein IPJ85_14560 [Flavobacteriales bacterium]|nr:hypothetical protein [Flavobacteriales bacterium]